MQQIVKIRLNQAFTLIEVMVVVVIMAILAAIVVPKIMSRPDQAKVVKVKEDIQAVENALDLYKLDNGQYPSQAQGLKALVSKPTTAPIPSNYASGGYVKRMPLDPWGHAYHYKNPGKHGDVDVFTYGANNKPTGTGINQTIGNWNIQKISSSGTEESDSDKNAQTSSSSQY